MPGEREPVELGLRQPRAAGRRRRRGGRPDRARPRRAAPASSARTSRSATAANGGVRRMGRSRRDVGDEVRDRLPVVGSTRTARDTRSSPPSPMRPCAVASVVRRKAEVRRQPRSRSSSWRAKRIGSGTPPAASRRRCWRAGSRAPAPGARAPSRARSARPSRGPRRRPGLDPERVEDAAEIVDPLRVHPRAGALREPHRDLVDGEHAVAVAEPLDGTSATSATTSGCRARRRRSAAARCRRAARRRGRAPARARRRRGARAGVRDQAGSMPRRSRRLASNAAGAGLTR